MVRSLISALMVFALVSAIVSPACAFVSGGSYWAEICRSLNATDVTSQDAGGSGAVEDTAGGTLSSSPDCGFCFAAHHMAPPVSGVDFLPVLIVSGYRVLSAGMIAPAGTEYGIALARGPPSSVLI